MTDELAEFRKRMDGFEETLKEREVHLIKAIITLINDWNSYTTGAREKFPREALMGLIYAYIRPRIAIAVAGFGAMLFAAIQVWLLLQQNQLISKQNEIANSQAGIAQMTAINGVLNTLLIGNSGQSVDVEELAISQMAVYSDQSFEVLAELGRNAGELGALARSAILRGGNTHSIEQSAIALGVFSDRFAIDHSSILGLLELDEAEFGDQIKQDAIEWLESANQLKDYWQIAALAHTPSIKPAAQFNFGYDINVFYGSMDPNLDLDKLIDFIVEHGNILGVMEDKEASVRQTLRQIDWMYSSWCDVSPRSLMKLVSAGEQTGNCLISKR